MKTAFRVATRKYRGNDLVEIKKWIRNPKIRNNFRFTAKIKSDKSLILFIKKQMRRTVKDSFINFVLYDKKDSKKTYIGSVGLKYIDLINKNAELTIVIGNENYLNKGYGQEALYLICDYGFNDLKLHKIYLHFIEHNTNARKAYERFGFRHEGVKREHILQNNKYNDEMIMGLLKPEFSQKKHE